MNIMVALSEEWQVDRNKHACIHAYRIPYASPPLQHTLTCTHATQEDLTLMFIADDQVA